MPNITDFEAQAHGYIESFNSFIDWFSQDPPFAIGTCTILLISAILVSVRKRLGDNLIDVTDKAVSQLTLLAISYQAIRRLQLQSAL